MSGSVIASAIYFVLLLLAVGGFILVEFKTRPGTGLRMAAAWAMIFIGILAVYGLWPHIRSAMSPTPIMTGDSRIEVPIRGSGHAYLNAKVNDTNIRFMVDTGASMVALNRKDAKRLGLQPDKLIYYQQAHTANGIVATAPVNLDTISIGDFTGRNIEAVVIDGDVGTSLLGMAFLRKFARISFERDRLLLEW